MEKSLFLPQPPSMRKTVYFWWCSHVPWMIFFGSFINCIVRIHYILQSVTDIIETRFIFIKSHKKFCSKIPKVFSQRYQPPPHLPSPPLPCLVVLSPKRVMLDSKQCWQRINKQTCNQHWIREVWVQVSKFLSLIVGHSLFNCESN